MSYGTRIPDLTYVGDLQDNISTNRTNFSRIQLQISSNKKFLNRSDDPISTNEASILKNDNTELSQWKSNIQMADGWEQATSSATTEIMTYMQRINELTVQAGDGTAAAATNRQAIADEVDGIIEALVTYGNTNYLGTYIFGGTKTTQPPFSVSRVDPTDPNNKQIQSVTYGGNTEQRTTQISTNATLNYGITGSDSNIPSSNQGMFRFNALINTGTTEAPVWTSTDVNIFDSLIKFRAAMDSETIPADSDITRRELQAAVGHITDKVVTNATSQQKLERLNKNIESMMTGTTNRIGELEELDMTEAAVQLNQMQNNLSASMQMITRMNQMSMVNFI